MNPKCSSLFTAIIRNNYEFLSGYQFAFDMTKKMVILVCALALSNTVFLFSQAIASDASIQSTRGVALVIGNAAYQKTRALANPVNDASDIGKALSDLGWDVLKYTDASLKSMKEAMRDFVSKLQNQKAGFFYYAGHGIQVDGINYLVPVDADVQLKSEVQDTTVSVDFILRAMEEANVPLKIVVLDACRDNPFEATRGGSSSRGLAVVGKAPSGTVIVYSTAPNDVSDDGKGRNGVFTEAFLPQLAMPGLEFKEIFDKTGELVRTKTNGSQNPWMNSSYYGKLYFISPQEAERSASARLDAIKQELLLLEQAKAAGERAMATAKDQAEKDRIQLEMKKTAALEAAKKEDALAQERLKNAAAARLAEEERNRESAAKRALEAEVQLASLKRQAEKSRASMKTTERPGDEVAVYYRNLTMYAKAISEIHARFNESLERRLTEIETALKQRGSDIQKYVKDPWENNEEFLERKREAAGLAQRDYEREVAGLKESFAKSAQLECADLEVKLTALEESLSWKFWVMPASQIQMARGNFDENKKSWTFAVTGSSPEFSVNLTYTITYSSRDELANKYTAIDNAWKSNALEARVYAGIRKIGPASWQGYIVSVSILDLSDSNKVIATKTINDFNYTPPKPYSAPGCLIISNPPALGSLLVGNKRIDMYRVSKGNVEINDVPTQEDVAISWSAPAGVVLDVNPETLYLNDAEARLVSFPTGTLTIPWLPSGSRIFLGNERQVELETAESGREAVAWKLLPGSYPIEIAGSVPYKGSITITSGLSAAPLEYQVKARAFLSSEIIRNETRIANLKPRRLFTLVSLGTSAAGLLATSLGYLQGYLANRAYHEAKTSEALADSREAMELWSTVFGVGTGISGLGLIIAPILWPWNNPETALRKSIAEFNSALETLK